MNVNDHYRNAVVGTLVSVDNGSWTDDGSSMVIVRCDEPFVRPVFVREFVINYRDAEMLVDRKVVLIDRHIYQIPTA